jgi:hypothetical protein
VTVFSGHAIERAIAGLNSLTRPLESDGQPFDIDPLHARPRASTCSAAEEPDQLVGDGFGGSQRANVASAGDLSEAGVGEPLAEVAQHA